MTAGETPNHCPQFTCGAPHFEATRPVADQRVGKLDVLQPPLPSFPFCFKSQISDLHAIPSTLPIPQITRNYQVLIIHTPAHTISEPQPPQAHKLVCICQSRFPRFLPTVAFGDTWHKTIGLIETGVLLLYHTRVLTLGDREGVLLWGSLVGWQPEPAHQSKRLIRVLIPELFSVAFESAALAWLTSFFSHTLFRRVQHSTGWAAHGATYDRARSNLNFPVLG